VASSVAIGGRLRLAEASLQPESNKLVTRTRLTMTLVVNSSLLVGDVQSGCGLADAIPIGLANRLKAVLAQHHVYAHEAYIRKDPRKVRKAQIVR
jgi:hypothetical protein